jgi:opacity protein-like surface antigen
MIPKPHAYDWSGFYVGGHFGYGWGHDNVPFGQLISPPNTINPGNSGEFNGAIGGLQSGYNFAVVQKYFLGVEFDVSTTNMKGERLIPIVNPTFRANHAVKLDWFGTVRARVGYSFDNTLIYGTGGLAWATIKTTRTQLSGSVFTSTPGLSEQSTFTSLGWVIGGGIEFALTQRWSTKLEYLYADIGTTTITRDLIRQYVQISDRWSIARVGLNYKF